MRLEKGLRRVPFLLHRSSGFGARPQGVSAPLGPLTFSSPTVAPWAPKSEPESTGIGAHPHLSPRFQALVPEMEGDSRRCEAITK